MSDNAEASLPEHLAEVVAGLTPPQREAVMHTEGALLVLAGPGSGKTRVITRRIAYLIGCGIPPYQILAVTFTNKAAKEMRERVAHLLGEGVISRGLMVTTFHALCARLLRKYADIAGLPGLTGTFAIYDTDDQTALIKRSLETLNLSTTNWPPRAVLGRISNAKNDLQDAETFSGHAMDFSAKTVAKIYLEYQRGLRAANAVDFDDLLLLTAKMLRTNAEVRSACQNRWRYLMVDEYQDTNKAQFVIASLIAGGNGSAAGAEAPPESAGSSPNICVVGDPDQSIYGWRGADISNILDFEEQFPNASVIALGENFRSTKHIIGAADALIQHNAKRKHKNLFTSNAMGERIEVTLCRDEHHEARLVADWIKRLKDESAGTNKPLAWKDFAIFYRTNALSRVMEDVLRGDGLPYAIARGTAFYQREEIKNALAYLRVVANPADDVSLTRIINTPARGIGDTTLERVSTLGVQQGKTLLETLRVAGQLLNPPLQPRATTAIGKFLAMMDQFAGVQAEGMLALHAPAAEGSLAELVERIIRESGLEQMYKADDGDKGEDRLENLAELVSSARDFEETYDPAGDPAYDGPLDPNAPVEPPTLWHLLRAYLERVTLVADADAVDPSQGAITLMTLHAAKGLEFPGVAMIGLEEGLLPHSRVNEQPGGGDELEEERRLCFVGITRAMQRLLITSARYRTVRGIMERTIPSRFLSELPKEHTLSSDHAGFAEPGWDTPPADVGDAFRDGASFSAAGSDRPRRAAGGAKDVKGRPLQVGVSVRHPQFGVGTIASISGGGSDARAQIQFRDVGVKTLVLQYARLERIG